MKVLDAKVNWMQGWGNDPTLKVLVDKLPSHDELVYEQKGTLYYTHKDGYVSFFHYSKPDDGYGGSKFELKMKDGSIKTLVGPWSSREGVMNAAGFIPSVNCAITDEEDVWKKGYTFYSGSISLLKAIDAARIAKAHLIMKMLGTGFSKGANGEQSHAFDLYDKNEIGEFIFIPSIRNDCIDKPQDEEKNEHRGGFKPINGTLIYDHEENKVIANELIESYLFADSLEKK